MAPPYAPYMPYFQQMYREANGWNSLFYTPHDPEGVVGFYPSHAAVQAKLDSLLSEPWCGLEEYLVTVPIFERVTFTLPKGPFTIRRKGKGEKITKITYGGKPIERPFIPHSLLTQGKDLIIHTY